MKTLSTHVMFVQQATDSQQIKPNAYKTTNTARNTQNRVNAKNVCVDIPITMPTMTASQALTTTTKLGAANLTKETQVVLNAKLITGSDLNNKDLPSKNASSTTEMPQTTSI